MNHGPTTLDLLFPPSVNRIWRNYNGRMVLNPHYAQWKRRVDAFLLYQKVKPARDRVAGKFIADIILDEAEWLRAGDADNRIKAVLDYAQRVELIDNDKLAKKVSIEWGAAPHGCRLTITGLRASDAQQGIAA